MKDYEALELQVKAMRLVEGTKLDWWECIARKGNPFWGPPSFTYEKEEYRLALAIVEGKPVFGGDKLYTEKGDELIADAHWLFPMRAKCGDLSWNPPKPKTVMIELTVDSIKQIVRWSDTCGWVQTELKDACRKALENIK